MLLLGVIIGVVAGFLLSWWFAVTGPPPTSFFLRFLKAQSRSARLDTRLMLHDLHCKVEDLSRQVCRLDLQLQDIKAEEMRNTLKNISSGLNMEREALLNNGCKPVKNPERWQEIERLFQQGLSPGEVARELNIGIGELELVLSLGKSRHG